MNRHLQTCFGFFESGCNRSGAVKLNVFRPEKIRELKEAKENPAGIWVAEKLSGGQKAEVAYVNWLKFFTPLSHSQEFSL